MLRALFIKRQLHITSKSTGCRNVSDIGFAIGFGSKRKIVVLI
jgi:hypothetical protein